MMVSVFDHGIHVYLSVIVVPANGVYNVYDVHARTVHLLKSN